MLEDPAHKHRCLPCSCQQPHALLPAYTLLLNPHQGWSLVGNLMDPFRTGQELGSATLPTVAAGCDAETSPGILPAPSAPCFGSLLSHHMDVSFSLPKLL